MGAVGQASFADVHRRLFTAVVVLNLLLVLLHLTIQLVEHGIDGCIQIIAGFLDMHVLARNMNGNFRFLLELLYRKHHVHASHLIEVTDNRIKLGFNVLAQSRCNVDVMTTDLQIHYFLLSLQGLA